MGEGSEGDKSVISQNGLGLDGKSEHERAFGLLRPITSFICCILSLSDAGIGVKTVI